MNDLIEKLNVIGFTEYEAKVYLALLKENPANGYQVSKRAGIPRSMVYEALGRLERRGAVLKREGARATVYRPLPPDTLLDQYEQEQSRAVAELRESLRTLHQAPEEEELWSLKGREAMLSVARQLIEAAEQELMLVLSDADLEALEGVIVKATTRGVIAKALLTGQGALPGVEVAHHPPLESEMHQLTDMLVIVADQRRVVIASGEEDTIATVTSNHNMVRIAHQFIWMELFTQRVNASIGAELLDRLSPQDRTILESLRV